MRDVAKLAGVSQSTVSRILSQSPSSIPYSEETYKRVHDAIAQLKYRPNMTASSLRTQRSFMIAVMIADITNAFYHSITKAIQDVARQHRYDVIIAATNHVHEDERRFCEAMLRRPVDGIILVPYHLTSEDIDHLIEGTGAPVAVLARHIDHPLVDRVSAEDEHATYATVRWLVETKGYQRVGFIGVDPAFDVGARRERAYRRALADMGIAVAEGWVAQGDFTLESGASAMQALLDQSERPDAVFCCNDTMAIGALNTCLDTHIRVPEDMGIVGFDNIPATQFVRPRLTTVAQFPAEIGLQLAEALFERVEGTYTGEGRFYDLPCRLIERDST